MNTMIVLRLDGQEGYLLVDPASGTVRPVESQDMPPAEAPGAKKYAGVAEAYALPVVPNLPSRRFFRH